MAEPPGEMETLSAASERLRAAGYTENWEAVDGALRCWACGTDHAPTEVTVDEVVRFEGPSDPGDESILFALNGPCGHRGQYSVGYGPSTPADEIAVVKALGAGR